MTGFTTWRVGGNSVCILSHASAGNTAHCGPNNTFTATAGAGFGMTGSSFSSTLSGSANSTLNGTLVECFGPGIDRSIENMVGNITLQTLGLRFPKISTYIIPFSSKDLVKPYEYCNYWVKLDTGLIDLIDLMISSQL